ncbi:actin-like [Anopheles maculipalpis]|uniref:actin-like n=1 Tax=Anopheles maculipalpis TaxID=1496333 RepID=UPI002159AC35|nr:actin-like [Anopheles maculipalpis]
MSVEETPAIIIDNGSHTLKVGFAGDDDPKETFRNVVQLTESTDGIVRSVGVASNPASRVVSPIQRGQPCDWEAMESVWEYTFKDVLKIASEDHNVLLTDRPLSGRADREKAAQIMFEKFSTPATYLSMQATLALYGAGRISGTVVDVGDGCTSIVPILKGTPTIEASKCVDLAGCDMVNYLANALNVSDREIAREVMEKVCAVSGDMEKEVVNKVEFKASDGSVVNIGAERYRCGEAMFNPSVIGQQNVRPVQELIAESVASCKETNRKDLYAYIVLVGGSTMLKGFSERLQSELTKLVPSQYRCKVVTTQDPILTVWAGGCLVAQSPMFQQSWVTKQEYEEYGADVIHRKCV